MYILVLAPVPGTPKTLVISQVIKALGASFVLIFYLWLWFLTVSSKILWNILGDRIVL